MNSKTKTEPIEVIAVSAHARVNWDDETPALVEGHECLIVNTDAGNWIAVCDMHANVGEPVTVVQSMKSSKLRRPGRVWAKWNGTERDGYWPPDVPSRMPVYIAQDEGDTDLATAGEAMASTEDEGEMVPGETMSAHPITEPVIVQEGGPMPWDIPTAPADTPMYSDLADSER